MRRIVLLFVVALLAFPLSAGARTSQPTPVPLPPDQAAALMNGPSVAGAPIVRQVTPQQAYAAASLPGAVTQLAPGLTLRQAVGLSASAAPTPPSPATDPAVRQLTRAFGGPSCWSGQLQNSWGTYPYTQTVYDHTYWCAYVGGAITYRSTTTTTGTALCSSSDPSSFLLSGGAGYAFAAYQVGANFTCPTAIPWVSLHASRWIDDEVNDYGSIFTYQSS